MGNMWTGRKRIRVLGIQVLISYIHVNKPGSHVELTPFKGCDWVSEMVDYLD